MILKEHLYNLVLETYSPLDDNCSVFVEHVSNHSSFVPGGCGNYKTAFFIKVKLDSFSKRDSASESTFLEMWYCYNKNKLVFDEVRVYDDFRGKGLGSLMVKKSEALAKIINCDICRVEADVNRRGFWQKRDYEYKGDFVREKHI